MPQLEVFYGNGESVIHPLVKRTSLGRSDSNTLAFDDTSVSGEHALLCEENGIWTISDLNSVNGTFVNSQRVTKRELRDRDVVRFGAVEAVFILANPPLTEAYGVSGSKTDATKPQSRIPLPVFLSNVTFLRAALVLTLAWIGVLIHQQSQLRERLAVTHSLMATMPEPLHHSPASQTIPSVAVVEKARPNTPILGTFSGDVEFVVPEITETSLKELSFRPEKYRRTRTLDGFENEHIAVTGEISRYTDYVAGYQHSEKDFHGYMICEPGTGKWPVIVYMRQKDCDLLDQELVRSVNDKCLGTFIISLDIEEARAGSISLGPGYKDSLGRPVGRLLMADKNLDAITARISKPTSLREAQSLIYRMPILERDEEYKKVRQEIESLEWNLRSTIESLARAGKVLSSNSPSDADIAKWPNGTDFSGFGMKMAGKKGFVAGV